MTAPLTPISPGGNVDAGEVAKFGALAHHWWDSTSTMFGPLHKINPLRLRWIEQMSEGVEAKHIVDVGCGGGILSESLAARGARVVGIDLGEKALGVAKLHQLESGSSVDYRLVAAESPGAFDIVTCMELLEHVPDPASIIAACAALAKPGGLVVISTINRNPKAYALAILAAEYVLQMLPRGTHELLHGDPVRDRRRDHGPGALTPDAGGNRRLWAASRPRRRGNHRHDLQPVGEDVLARPGHRRQLHDGFPPSGR